MRLLSARLIVSLIIGVTLVSLCSSYYQVLMLNRSLQKDLQRRAEVLGESLARNVERDLDRERQAHFAANGPAVRQPGTSGWTGSLRSARPSHCRYDQPSAFDGECARHRTAIPPAKSRHQTLFCGWEALRSTSMHCPCIEEMNSSAAWRSFTTPATSGRESLRIWRETFLSALAHVFLIVLITLLIVRWSIAGPIARTANWMKALRTGRGWCGSKSRIWRCFVRWRGKSRPLPRA